MFHAAKARGLNDPAKTEANPAAQPDQTNIVGQAKEKKVNPAATALIKMRDRDADIDKLLHAMNETFAVVKYGSKIVIAVAVRKDFEIMKVDDFHNMLANLVVQKELKTKRQ